MMRLRKYPAAIVSDGNAHPPKGALIHSDLDHFASGRGDAAEPVRPGAPEFVVTFTHLFAVRLAISPSEYFDA